MAGFPMHGHKYSNIKKIKKVKEKKLKEKLKNKNKYLNVNN